MAISRRPHPDPPPMREGDSRRGFNDRREGNNMKPWDERILMGRILVLALAAWAVGGPPSLAAAQAPSAPLNPRIVTPDFSDLPAVIVDDGVVHWVVDRFAGNTRAGTVFYQGAAREVGGLQYPWRAVEASDGVYLAVHEEGADNPNLLRVGTDGMLRLVMEREGVLEGPIELCQGGYPFWNSYDQTLYLTGPYCIRKVVKDGAGKRSVVRVAGTCGTEGSTDGPAVNATLRRARGWVAAQDGAIYWLEDRALRKFANGTISTVPLTRPETPGWLWNLSPGMYLLSAGEDAHTLYISNYYDTTHGYSILRCDLKTNTLSRIVGVPRGHPNHGNETDGPALTSAAFRGGGRGLYHADYRAIFLDGADPARFRWWRLAGDGWVRTAFGTARPEIELKPFGIVQANSRGVEGEQFRLGSRIVSFAGTGENGSIYLIGYADKTGFWRARAPELIK